ncbi:hypothetical protein HJC23_013084 [Cyclotella cryptica]|uniref:PPIase cyclophilin-type domain-containing protein n=1 Tax=Cyclotella cryptica TaxID=29204 RepID=A0ABD3Q7L8_9STRA|eukprot:CCRYP_008145-RA/>CCRYP_008145-RA protein AED:0.03 eAED:0.03 QI:304/1/1/1/1/1/2/820/640
MELRQRGQRPSEPTDQNQSSASPWIHQRQTSTSSVNSLPPPPPPPRTPSTPAVHSSPMFTNPNFYAQHSMSARNLSGSMASTSSMHSVGAGTPLSSSHKVYQAPYNAQRAASVSYANPAYTAPPAVGLNRCNTEPYYQTDVLAGSNAVHSPVAPGRALNYSFGAQSSGAMNSSGSLRSSSGYGEDQGVSTAYFDRSYSDPRRTASAPAVDAARGYGGYINASATGSSSSLSNLNNQNNSSSFTANPYKSTPKSTSCARLLTNLAYLSILILTGTTLYLRHAIHAAAQELESAHSDAHRRHLTHVKKTGGRHGPGSQGRTSVDHLARQNQQREIQRLERANQQLMAQINEKHEEHEQLSRSLEEERGRLDELEQTKQDLHRLIDHNENLLDVLNMEREKHAAMLQSKEELDAVIEKRETALWKSYDRLTERVGQESYREAVDWFGPGPHKVEIELSYPQVPPEDHPNPRSWTRVSKWIVIEMASLDLMPHSVNMFLRQVQQKLWDGISINLKNDQKIQFGPRADDDRFLRAHSSTLFYQEYNTTYPHQQWTVGFAGRPAGPDFFINRMDNTAEFGLKGDKHKEADPCFGRVIEGFDILEDIGNIPHFGGAEEEGLAALYDVKIVRALIIPPKIEEKKEMEH